MHEIARELGFSDLSSFSQAYKRWTGVAPSFTRQQAGLS
jgi:AraC-like DNA-binding protein